MSQLIRVLCIGDVVGLPGRMMLQKHLAKLKADYKADCVIVNGENSTNKGRGITPKIVHFFKHIGVDVVTTGNHVWAAREIQEYLLQDHTVLRPANFPSGTPGVGVTTIRIGDALVGVVNLQGRVFMREHVDCPFRAAETILTYLRYKTALIFVDLHAETTAEKAGLAFFLDGRVSAVFGTHTHVQTADERVLPGGTAFITDLGMVGSLNSMLGMRKDEVIAAFMTQMPYRFVVDTTMPLVLSGVVIEVNTETGLAVSIERVRIFDETLTIPTESDHKNE